MAFDISVVIPAHNRAHTLPYCLDSVLAQTLPPREVIVVDDRSSDDTAAVLQRYAARGVVHLRLAAGQGAQAARNAGVRAARWPWIAFQDSDDLWLPDKLALQCDALRAASGAPDVVVHGNGLRREPDSGLDTPLPVPDASGRCFNTLLRHPGPMFQALLVSRQALDDCGGLDEACPSYQEWDTALRLARRCRFVHLQPPLFVWVWHAGETISKSIQRDLLGYNYVLDRYRGDITQAHGPAFWRAQKLNQAVRAMRAGLWDVTLQHLQHAGSHRSLALARLLARRRLVTPGTGRVLKWLA
jgi:glycosyltransferase involved in cell wall biosynthesis